MLSSLKLFLLTLLAVFTVLACQPEEKKVEKSSEKRRVEKEKPKKRKKGKSSSVKISRLKSQGPNGERLFRSYCAPCHHPTRKLIGPPLKDARKRVPTKDWIYRWVRNPDALLKQREPYAYKLFEEYNYNRQTAFPDLSDQEIDAILDFCDTFDPDLENLKQFKYEFFDFLGSFGQ